ncbi:hypothetical protein [Holophaga foetida]|uniref:hypothetical protein n=1 Tax=Holophaga foetida TaxID=35839 RepID=UPI0002472F1E|nr:hypothetical protein [Holophaga foetida]
MVNKYFKSAATLGATALMLVALTACGGSSSNSAATTTTSLTIDSDNATISATTKVTTLTIADVLPVAASGSLTLTVDGVETPIAAGTYTSSSSTGVVLEPTELIEVTNGGYTYDWRTAAYIEDGAPVLSKSVTSAVQGLTLTESLTSLDGATITSVGPAFNGIVVTATDSTTAGDFKINNLTMNLTGNGGTDFDSTTYVEYGNDFSGVGAGLVTQGYANVTLNSPSIITDGVVRTAILVKEHSTLQCNAGYIQTGGGQLCDDEELFAAYWTPAMPTIIAPGYMVMPPFMLGIKGDCRATNLLDYATATYNDTTFSTKNWGALSVDTNTSVRLNVNNCKVTVTDSGYASYTIGDDSKVYYNDCTVTVPDMVLIAANGAASGYFRNDTVTSGRFGMVIWGNSGGTFEVDGGTWSTVKGLFVLKGSYPNVTIKNGASITSANGRILETATNDDSGGGNGSGTSATLTIDNSTVTGDIIHGFEAKELDVVISGGASVTGAISIATATEESTLDGVLKTVMPTPNPDSCSYFGAFDYTYGYTTGSTLNVTLSGASTWTITAPKANNTYTGTESSMAPTNLVYAITSLTQSGTSSIVVGSGVSVSIQECNADGSAVSGVSAISLASGATYTSSLTLTTGAYFKITVTEN